MESSFYLNKKCLAKDFQCPIDNSILVWKQEIFHECPFELIFEAKFKLDDNFFVNYEENMLLEPIERVNQCNMSLLKKNQGFYIAKSKQVKKKSKKGRSIRKLLEI